MILVVYGELTAQATSEFFHNSRLIRRIQLDKLQIRNHSSRMRTVYFSDSGRVSLGRPPGQKSLPTDPPERDPLEGTWDRQRDRK